MRLRYGTLKEFRKCLSTPFWLYQQKGVKCEIFLDNFQMEHPVTYIVFSEDQKYLPVETECEWEKSLALRSRL